MIATYGYDNDSRVTSITYGTGGSCSSPPSNLGNLTYTYDSAGRRTATAGSLAAVTLPANVSGGSKTAYNADNEQTKFNNTRLSYDSNGNLTGDGTNTYTIDARNHRTAISGGATASFVYDGFGRRMKKTIGSSVTQFLYDGLNPVQELNGSNGIVANLLTELNIDEYFARTDSGGNISSLSAGYAGLNCRSRRLCPDHCDQLHVPAIRRDYCGRLRQRKFLPVHRPRERQHRTVLLSGALLQARRSRHLSVSIRRIFWVELSIYINMPQARPRVGGIRWAST